MCLATGARRGSGLPTPAKGAASPTRDRFTYPTPTSIHAVDRYWRVAEALGAGDGPKRFDVPLQPAEVEVARADSPAAAAVVAVAVGASG